MVCPWVMPDTACCPRVHYWLLRWFGRLHAQGFIFYSGTYDSGNRTYTSATFGPAWTSDPKICNSSKSSDAPLAVPCETVVFDWGTPGPTGAKDIKIYSPNDLKNPIFSINGVQHVPFTDFWGPDTALYIPQLSAFRLYIMDAVIPLTDGVNADGTPRVVDHVLFDSDFGGPASLAYIQSIGGSEASKLSGWMFPFGLKMLYPQPMKLGFPRIASQQMSF